MKLLRWRFIPLVLFVLMALFFWRGLSLDPKKLPSSRIGQALPAFQLPVLGEPDSSFTSEEMKGQVALLNVWASWCAACVDEQVFLLRLAREGVPIYGLNYKDDSQNAQRWLTEWGNPYRAIAEDKSGRVAIDLGVYGAPETFLVDKMGIIRYRHAGVLDETTWQKDVLPLVKQLKDES
ncbi:DsbE family thiol:disulfide interchange protein [Legionella spiritensis]|uniref:Cytochrome C biogenesis protein n=1 Tax=Legionella spiritensis TaxID=452 RepID=A0A0W0Z8V7_LEGSP|nr:DsbE family thiol:disulfide interchange protein [Legionella spiritensis]KTD65505.1 cytochrome C biogenesis protein [Legionella spiritensis]SNV35996.1 cytochrome c biogenesis protein CcmG, thiol-disulfide interchange protein DsbE [Legionella spiritensis]